MAIQVKDAVGATQTVNTLPALGQATEANSLPVCLASDSDPLAVGGLTATATASFTRPANTTAYTADDYVGANTTPLSFTVARTTGGSAMINRARIRTSKVMAGSEVMRLHLFRSTLTLPADNAAFTAAGRAADYLGYFDCQMTNVFSDGSVGFGVPNVGAAILVNCNAGTVIYGALQVLNGYTPGSADTFDIALEHIRD